MAFKCIVLTSALEADREIRRAPSRWRGRCGSNVGINLWIFVSREQPDRKVALSIVDPLKSEVAVKIGVNGIWHGLGTFRSSRAISNYSICLLKLALWGMQVELIVCLVVDVLDDINFTINELVCCKPNSPKRQQKSLRPSSTGNRKVVDIIDKQAAIEEVIRRHQERRWNLVFSHSSCRTQVHASVLLRPDGICLDQDIVRLIVDQAVVEIVVGVEDEFFFNVGGIKALN